MLREILILIGVYLFFGVLAFYWKKLPKDVKKVSIALFVLCNLVVLHWWKVLKTEQAEKKKEQEQKIVKMTLESMTKIKVQSKEGTFVFQRREKNKEGEFKDAYAPLSQEFVGVSDWVMVEPVAELSDPYVVKNLFTELKELSFKKIVQEDSKDLAAFGLIDSVLKIQLFEGQNKIAKFALEVGDENTAATGFYVKTSETPRVYLTETKSLESIKQKKTQDWLSKEIIGFQGNSNVKKLTLSYSNQPTIVLSKDKDTWKLEKPEALPGDKKIIDDFVNDMTSLRADFLEKDKGKMDIASVTKSPVATMVIDFEVSDKKHQRQLILVNYKLNDYVVRKDLNKAFLISAPKGINLRKQVYDFVNKEVFSLVINDWTAVHAIQNKGKNIVLVKKDKQWSLAPEKDKPALPSLEQNEVTTFLFKLDELRAKKYLGSSKPSNMGSLAWTVQVKTNDKEEEVLFYTSGKDAFFVQLGKPARYYKIDKTSYEDWIQALDHAVTPEKKKAEKEKSPSEKDLEGFEDTLTEVPPFEK